MIIEAHNNRNGKSPGNIQSPENFHTHIEVRSTFFNRIHVGEVGEIAQVYFLEADAHANESLSMARIGVMTILMVLTDVIYLGEVIGQQTGNQFDHARVGGGGGSFLDDGFNSLPSLLGTEVTGGLINRLRIQPTIKAGRAIEARHMDPEGIGIGVDAE